MGDDMNELSRLELQIGKDNLEKIKNTTVLIIGLGGVGGYTLEALTRSGIGNLIIVDNDIVDITNLNRQVISLHSNIGDNKVDVACKRILDINPNCKIVKINDFITKDNIDILFNEKIDYIVDACDTIETKKQLIRESVKRNIKIISSMGTGNKLDPSKLKITDIRKTNYDPIAKILRKMIKDERINKKIPVVYSDEEVIKTNSNTISSNAFVPATSGLLMASFVINDIIKE